MFFTTHPFDPVSMTTIICAGLIVAIIAPTLEQRMVGSDLSFHRRKLRKQLLVFEKQGRFYCPRHPERYQGEVPDDVASTPQQDSAATISPRKSDTKFRRWRRRGRPRCASKARGEQMAALAAMLRQNHSDTLGGLEQAAQEGRLNPPEALRVGAPLIREPTCLTPGHGPQFQVPRPPGRSDQSSASVHSRPDEPNNTDHIHRHQRYAAQPIAYQPPRTTVNIFGVRM